MRESESKMETIASWLSIKQDVNELTGWISAIRKTCKYNSCRIDTFHPGVFKGDKWNCCHREQDVGECLILGFKEDSSEAVLLRGILKNK